MGKLKVDVLKHLDNIHFKVLKAIEQGMKNHELVPKPLVIQIANVRSGGIEKILKELTEKKKRLVNYERGKESDGYRLTNQGYDYLALRIFAMKDVLAGVGSQMGVGKESDIYLVTNDKGDEYCMKIHRLGRTSFRKVREKRDYCKGKTNWLNMSRFSATKEYAFMKALYEAGFPVPEPIDFNRHIVIMQRIIGYPLNQIRRGGIENVELLYNQLMNLIVKMANHGVIHSDFNEFNVMIDNDDNPVLIDFPQMVSTSHQNAKMYFDRDVHCVVIFFKRRFNFEGEYPNFDTDVIKEFELDRQVYASGYSKEIKDFDKLNIIDEEEENILDEERESSDDDSDSDNDSSEERDSQCEDNEDESSTTSTVKEKGIASRNPHTLTTNKMDNILQWTKSINISDNSTDTLAETGFSTTHSETSNEQYNTDLSAENGEKLLEPVMPEELFEPSLEKVNPTCEAAPIENIKEFKRLQKRQTELKRREKQKQLISDVLKDRDSYYARSEVACSERGIRFDDTRSVISYCTSTVPPEEIQKRVRADLVKLEKKQISMKKIRIKGEANAKNRTRKETSDEIKESVGWDEY